MKEDINYYNYHVGEGRDEYQPNNELTWNAYIEDRNANTIKVFNIFNSFRFISGVIKANNKYKNDFEFLQEVRSSLMYAFWSKSEYEVIITSWPPYIEKEEFERLTKEDIKYRTWLNLSMGEKIDIYNQVMINWEAFKLYLLTNRKLIPKKIIS
jgi:hypothetical protein